MTLTNPDKLKRDARSLLRIGWNVDRIAAHLAANPEEYGTAITIVAVRPIIAAELAELQKEVDAARAVESAARAEIRAAIRQYLSASNDPVARMIASGPFRIRI